MGRAAPSSQPRPQAYEPPAAGCGTPTPIEGNAIANGARQGPAALLRAPAGAGALPLAGAFKNTMHDPFFAMQSPTPRPCRLAVGP